MAPFLTTEQLAELERSTEPHPRVENPRTHQGYNLVPSEEYEQVRPLFEAIIRHTRTSLSRPASRSTSPVVWSEEKNTRRCALIDKKYDSDLTTDEATELERLQTELSAHQQQVAPRPLAILELLEDALKQRSASVTSGDA